MDLNYIRRYFAEEIRAVGNIRSEALVDAFAKVPRERFLGPGPWQIQRDRDENYRTTEDADPWRLYHRGSLPARLAPLLLDLRHTAAGFWEPREDQRIVPRRNQPRVGGKPPHPLLRFEI